MASLQHLPHMNLDQAKAGFVRQEYRRARTMLRKQSSIEYTECQCGGAKPLRTSLAKAPGHWLGVGDRVNIGRNVIAQRSVTAMSALSAGTIHIRRGCAHA